MLHGPGTDAAAVVRLRQEMRRWKPARAELMNYRKDGGELWAEMDLPPWHPGRGRRQEVGQAEQGAEDAGAEDQRGLGAAEIQHGGAVTPIRQRLCRAGEGDATLRGPCYAAPMKVGP